MSQRVPSWELEDPLLHHRHEKHASLPPADATSAYNEIAELTWKDGHLATLGIRQHRVGKPIPRYPCPAASSAVGGGGTLECIVDQARRASSNPDLLSWLGGAHSAAADALVPCAEAGSRKRGRAAERNCPSQGSTTPRSARKVETCELTAARDGGGEEEAGFSTSVEDEEEGGGGGLPETENGSFAGGGPLVVDEHDSVCPSLRSQGDGFGERGVTSISTKRSRVAAVHNQSERKRRDRINQKMRTLQKLLPNSNKTDKASMLDEVIDYLKLLQAQVQMMRTIPTMMLPISMQQQQFQMSLMAQMAQMTQMARMTRMGMGLGMMDPSLLGGPGCTGLTPPPPILHPSTFLPLPSTATGAWEAPIAEWMGQPGCRVLPDMFSAFMGYPAQQPMSTEAYSRMATLYQKLYQQPLGSNQKA